MTVLVSLVVILIVAALVGRTCARSRPGARPAGAPPTGLGIELPDVVGERGAPAVRGPVAQSTATPKSSAMPRRPSA